VANLPPVSTTKTELVAKFAAGVVDTVCKFAAGVMWCTLTCDFLEKIRNDPKVIFRGLGEGDS
jgi:hypothetical protein